MMRLFDGIVLLFIGIGALWGAFWCSAETIHITHDVAVIQQFPLGFSATCVLAITLYLIGLRSLRLSLRDYLLRQSNS